jgi:hypothetical protein
MKGSQHFPEQQDFTSVLSKIELASDEASRALGGLSASVPRPHGAVGLGHACTGANLIGSTALVFLGDPNEIAQALSAGLTALKQRVFEVAPQAREPAMPKFRKLLKFGGWKMLIGLGQPQAAPACMVAGGLLLLKALAIGKPISGSQALGIVAEAQRCDLTLENLRTILDSDQDAEAFGYPWLDGLQRDWPKIKNLLTLSGGSHPPKAPTFGHRVRGRLIGAAEHPSYPHRAGTPDHRHLSEGQFEKACEVVNQWLDADDWRGIYAVVGAISPLTADMLGDVPLASAAIDGWVIQVDDAEGNVQTDCNCIAKDAAAPPVHGTVVPSSFISATFLPAKAVARLRERKGRFPSAAKLSELYPEAKLLRGEDALYPSTAEIVPSWSRWLNSFGLFMRRAGHDNFIVCAVSGDFGHAPKSKSFYASLSRAETWLATNSFYQQIKWGPAEPDLKGGINFGCQVVPPPAAVLSAHRSLITRLEEVRVAKRDGEAKLLEFHNRYVRVAAFPVIGLMGLREDAIYDIWADIHEGLDLWAAVFDKHTPGPDGALPVAICEHVWRVITAFRAHCKAVAWRLRTMGYGKSSFHHWLQAVVEREHVHLFCLASSPDRIAPLGTADVIGRLDPKDWLAPDAGRKLLENEGRHRGLRTGDIDALLRHDVKGQSRTTSASDFVLAEWLRRVRPVLDEIAREAFCPVVYGLSKE